MGDLVAAGAIGDVTIAMTYFGVRCEIAYATGDDGARNVDLLEQMLP